MTNAPQTPVAPHAREWTEAGRIAELRGDGPHTVSAAGVDLVVLRVAGRLKAYEGRCPHQGALLGEGELDGGTLVCRNHRWRFDAETGTRQGGTQCLMPCPVREEADRIYVDVRALVDKNRGVAAGHRTLADLPGPPGWPVVGNFFQVASVTMHQQLERWAAQYGPMYFFRLGDLRAAVISDPDLREQILRARPETYRRGSRIEPIFEELGVAGVFSAEGSEWRTQRRLAMGALGHHNLRGFYPTLHQVAERFVRRLQKWAERGETIEVVEELKRVTVDVTTALAFGYDINTLEQTGDDVIQRRLELIFPAFSRRLTALFPWWRFARLPIDRKVDRAVADLRTWLKGLIVQARARIAADPGRAERPTNFLEAMLVARDPSGEPFSEDVVCGNLMTMLLAGEDTTAYTLAWAVHHLCENADVAAALRKDIARVQGDAPLPSDIEVANRLAYAGAVANESMRLRPVAPFFLQEALIDTVIGDLRVPAGTTVIALSRPAALDAARFKEADAFRPERWLDPERHAPHDPSAVTPFGSGPRICPGRALALLEMKVVLSALYQNFDVERSGPASDVHEVLEFTMHPQGVKVRLRPRKLAS